MKSVIENHNKIYGGEYTAEQLRAHICTVTELVLGKKISSNSSESLQLDNIDCEMLDTKNQTTRMNWRFRQEFYDRFKFDLSKFDYRYYRQLITLCYYKCGIDFLGDHIDLAHTSFDQLHMDGCFIIGKNDIVYHQQMTIGKRLEIYADLLNRYNVLSRCPFDPNKTLDFYSFFAINRVINKMNT